MHLLWLFTLIFANSLQHTVLAQDRLLTKLFRSLNHVLKFALDNEIDDFNFLFGVAIVKGQLIVSRKYIEAEPQKRAIVDQLELLADVLLQNLPDGENYPLIKSASPDLWTQDFRPEYLHQQVNTVANTDEMKPDGRPTPEESNYCIGLLVANCSTPKECTDIEAGENSSGYALTHQILYYQLLRGMGCNQQTKQYTAIINDKCRRIYQENVDILARNLPSHLQDLFLEQVVVCGLEGFMDFLTLFNLRMTLSLQKRSGCFGVNEVIWKPESSSRCSLHLTGVGAASLSIFIKNILSNNLQK